jgi:predicted secreted hydrolase
MSAVMRTPRRWRALGCAVALTAVSLTACQRRPAVPAPATEDAHAPVATGRLAVLRSATQNRGFAQALEPRAFDFPADFGPHPQYRHEWWYLTGQLRAASGQEFGFELTFFRLALAPIAWQPEPGASRWRTREVYVAHFAITDIGARRFKFAQRYARAALGLAGAQAAPLRVWLEDWSISGEPDVAASSLPVWNLTAADGDDSIALHARALAPPVLNGDRGLSVKADESGAASYYYSIPRMAVGGRLARGGRAFEVSGEAWLDREWGSGGLGSEQQGWDWFALDLADGSALMFYALRERDGRRDPHSAGTWIGADGTTRPLTSNEVRIEAQDYWDSPRGGRYPARWRIEVAPLGLDLEVQPRLADQELDTRPRYWEGAVSVTGRRAGRPLGGRGYVELVGYAR